MKREIKLFGLIFALALSSNCTAQSKSANNEKPQTCKNLTQADAEKILGQAARFVEATVEDKGDLHKSRCTYTAVSKDETSGREINLFFMLEENSSEREAEQIYETIRKSNENHAGFEKLNGIGDEAYSHSEKPNFHFLIARRGKFTIRLKINKAVETTSLEELKNFAKKVIAVNLEQENAADKAGSVNAIRGMNTSRAAHTATLLNNGKVLVAGGFAGDENSLASAEIFDPKTNTFSSAGNMSFSRSGHSATVLPDGKVLIAGGYNGNYLDSAEIYDTKTGKFTPTGKMTLHRSGHIAVLLANGKVLLAGGIGTGWTFLAETEVYDPASNTFTKTKNMSAARESHTATLLKDGTVLIIGGHQGRRSAITIYQNAEIYNPTNDTLTATANLTVKRHKHDAALLDDGTVLIVGGSDERDSRGAYTTTEIYNPKTKTFAKIGEMNLSRYKLQGTTVLLKNGKILIAGGAARAEIYNPTTKTFDVAAGKFETARLFATATLLPNGQVLIVGGYDNNNHVSEQAWIYKS